MRLNITMMITAMRQVRPQAFLQLSQVQALRVRVWRRFLRQVLLHLLLVQAFILPPQALRVWLWRRLLRKDLLLVQAILPPSEVGELWVWRRLLWQSYGGDSYGKSYSSYKPSYRHPRSVSYG